MANFFKSIGALRSILSKVDFEKVNKLSQKVDLNKLLDQVGKMDDAQLARMMKMVNKKKKAPPPIEGDFYKLGDRLTEEERTIQLRVRDFMENEIRPIANKYWLEAEFPMHIIPKLAELNICGTTISGYGCPGHSALLEGFVAMEMARVDSSISTFFWGPERTGHGLDLLLRLRGTEKKVAA